MQQTKTLKNTLKVIWDLNIYFLLLTKIYVDLHRILLNLIVMIHKINTDGDFVHKFVGVNVHFVNHIFLE